MRLTSYLAALTQLVLKLSNSHPLYTKNILEQAFSLWNQSRPFPNVKIVFLYGGNHGCDREFSETNLELAHSTITEQPEIHINGFVNWTVDYKLGTICKKSYCWYHLLDAVTDFEKFVFLI